MGFTYFKRFRMEVALDALEGAPPDAPHGYRVVGWRPSLVQAHATAKYESFRMEIDANVFPCLGESGGCLRLMKEISRKEGFLPEATWLICSSPPGGEIRYCGTIQGIRDASGVGSIQNVGIVPEHRGRGLGTSLIHHALHGFRQAGLHKAYLEVTAQNQSAIRLYERIGFTRAKTVYKAVDLVDV